MAYDPTDAVTARALLEDALSWEAEPVLTTAQVDRAFALASSLDTDDVTVLYTSANLNKAAAWGWNVKLGKAVELFKLGASGGAEINEDQVYIHCREMAAAYGSGALSVTGESRTGRGMASVGMITTTSKSYWDTQP